MADGRISVEQATCAIRAWASSTLPDRDVDIWLDEAYALMLETGGWVVVSEYERTRWLERVGRAVYKAQWSKGRSRWAVRMRLYRAVSEAIGKALGPSVPTSSLERVVIKGCDRDHFCAEWEYISWLLGDFVWITTDTMYRIGALAHATRMRVKRGASKRWAERARQLDIIEKYIGEKCREVGVL